MQNLTDEITTEGARNLNRDTQHERTPLLAPEAISPTRNQCSDIVIAITGIIDGYVFYTSANNTVWRWFNCYQQHNQCPQSANILGFLTGVNSWLINAALFTRSLIKSTREHTFIFNAPFSTRIFFDLSWRTISVIAGFFTILPVTGFSLFRLLEPCQNEPARITLHMRNRWIDGTALIVSTIPNTIIYADSTRRLTSAGRRFIQGFSPLSKYSVLYSLYGGIVLLATVGFSYNNTTSISQLFTIPLSWPLWLLGTSIAMLRIPFYLDFGADFLEYLATKATISHLPLALLSVPSVLGITYISYSTMEALQAPNWLSNVVSIGGVGIVSFIANFLRLPEIMHAILDSENSYSRFWQIFLCISSILITATGAFDSMLGVLDEDYECPAPPNSEANSLYFSRNSLFFSLNRQPNQLVEERLENSTTFQNIGN